MPEPTLTPIENIPDEWTKTPEQREEEKKEKTAEEEAREKIRNIFSTPFLFRDFQDSELFRQIPRQARGQEEYRYPNLAGEVDVFAAETSNKIIGWYTNLPIDTDLLIYDGREYGKEEYKLDESEKESLGFKDIEHVEIISQLMNPEGDFSNKINLRSYFLEELRKVPELFSLFEQTENSLIIDLSNRDHWFGVILNKFGIRENDLEAIEQHKEEIVREYDKFSSKISEVFKQVFLKSDYWIKSQKTMLLGEHDFRSGLPMHNSQLLISSDCNWRICERQTYDYGIETIVKNQIKRENVMGVIEIYDPETLKSKQDDLSIEILSYIFYSSLDDSSVNDLLHEIGLESNKINEFIAVLNELKTSFKSPHQYLSVLNNHHQNVYCQQLINLMQEKVSEYFFKTTGINIQNFSGREMAIATAKMFHAPCYTRLGQRLWPDEENVDDFLAKNNARSIEELKTQILSEN